MFPGPLHHRCGWGPTVFLPPCTEAPQRLRLFLTRLFDRLHDPGRLSLYARLLIHLLKKHTMVNKEGKQGQPAKDAGHPGLHQLFVAQIKDIYRAEKGMAEVLASVREAAVTEGLKSAIDHHRSETERQVERLEQIFRQLEIRSAVGRCNTMSSLIEEVVLTIGSTAPGTMVRDAGLIIALQKIEHYEIAVYGSLLALAGQMNHVGMAWLLEQTLAEEKQADAILNELALTAINIVALAE